MECGKWRMEGLGSGKLEKGSGYYFCKVRDQWKANFNGSAAAKRKKKKDETDGGEERTEGMMKIHEGQLKTKEEEGWVDLESEERRGWKKMKWEAWREKPIGWM